MSLEACLAKLRYVKYGDEVLSSDHNTKFECLKLLRDRIVELADGLGVRSSFNSIEWILPSIPSPQTVPVVVSFNSIEWIRGPGGLAGLEARPDFQFH